MLSPIAIPMMSFLAGIIMGRNLDGKMVPVPFFYLAAFVLLSAVFLLLKKNKTFYAAVCLVFLLSGLFRSYSATVIPPKDISSYASVELEERVVCALIKSYPETRTGKTGTYYEYEAEILSLGSGEKTVYAKDNVLMRLYDGENPYFFGDIIAARGELSVPSPISNPAGFDFRRYLAGKGISAVLNVYGKENTLYIGEEKGPLSLGRRYVLLLRSKAAQTFDRYLPRQAAEFAKAIFLGIRSGLSEEENEPFVRTGTAHVMAISGQNIVMMVAAFAYLINILRVKNKTGYVLSILFVAGFTVFTGMKVPVIRSGIMLSLFFAGKMLSRRIHTLNSLLFAAFIICFFYPNTIFMPEFIFSFSAVAAIIVWDGYLKKREAGKRPVPRRLGKTISGVKDILSVSFVVWVMLMPVTAYYYNMVTPAVLIANLVAIPVVFMLMIVCAIFLVIGAAHAPAVIMLSAGKIIETLVTAMLISLEKISFIPGAFFFVSTPAWSFMAVYYFSIAAFFAGYVLDLRRLRVGRTRTSPGGGDRFSVPIRAPSDLAVVLVMLLIPANFFVWNEAFVFPNSFLTVTFFDAGKADSALIETRGGKVILIDGGRGPGEFGKECGRRIIEPYLRKKKIRTIDFVILTHAHADHIGGLFYVLDKFNVGTVFDAGPPANDHVSGELYSRFDALIKKKGIAHSVLRKGDKVIGIWGLDLYVLNPASGRRYDELNDNSLVIKLVTNLENSILFCGDAGPQAIKDILRFGDIIRSDIIKMPHHGSENGDMSVFREFIDMVDPVYSIMTTDSLKTKNNGISKYLAGKKVKNILSGISGAVVMTETGNGFAVTQWRRGR